MGACWLSIDLHVALWLDDKCFNNKPAVQVVGDFVLATHELHVKFINFVSDNTMPDIYLVLAVGLVRFWMRQKQHRMTTIHKYGRYYIPLTSSELDDLCTGIKEMREQLEHGKHIFYSIDPIYTITKISTIICHMCFENLEIIGIRIYLIP